MHTHDTVLYDGECRFCRSQIALLRRLDICGRLTFTSLHAASVAVDFPEITRETLLAQMVVVEKSGRSHGGAQAVRYLSRTLVLLWPLAIVLHIPGTLPLWKILYNWIARNRFRIAGRHCDKTCDEGTCKLP